jgi:dolichol-phosphate mannosyltransferase
MGIENATREFILVMDTDFTHRPDEIPLMLHIVEKVDLVSGSRFCAGGSMDSTVHYLASFAYNLLIRVIIRTQVQDNLGGFWVARTELIRKLPYEEIFYGYGDYYFRMLHYLQQLDAHLVEVPAHYTQRTAGASKSNFLKLLLKYSIEAIRLTLKKGGIEDLDRRRATNGPTA